MDNLKILSVGGSILVPKTGIDIQYLKKFRNLILKQVKKGLRFVLVIGGGATCRVYQQVAKEVVSLNDEDLDWIGIHTTIYNAHFIKYLFKNYTSGEIITNPTRKVNLTTPISIASGWKPGFSTDMDAVLLAKNFKAEEIINLSNVDYIYDKDPGKFKDAKIVKEIEWKKYRQEIAGSVWIPGKSAPFDPIASKLAEKLKLKVSFVNGYNLKEAEKAIVGKRFKGTVIL